VIATAHQQSPAQLAPTGPIDLWVVSLQPSRGIQHFLTLLGPDEVQRAARFTNEDVRRRYVVSHAALRHVLGERIGVSPAELRFCRGKRGKPRLVDMQIAFNLSHSADLALIGVADHGAIGVDLERTQLERRFDLLSRRVLTNTERNLLSWTDDARSRANWFYQCWTAKEAVAKAFGVGLALAPHRMDVAPNGPMQAVVTVAPSGGGGPLPDGAEPIEVRWTPISDGFVAALAAKNAWQEHRTPHWLELR